MTPRPPRSQETPPPESRRQAVIEELLGAALAACRQGALEDLVSRRPGLVRRLAARRFRLVAGTAGEALAGDRSHAQALELWLRARLALLRPDRRPGLDGIPREAWTDRTSWRPLLALLCHFGLQAVPDFPQRYRRRPDESAADNLCGLWGVGPSTFYRYLDKGRRLLREGLLAPDDGESARQQRLSVQAWVHRQLGLQGPENEPQRREWHLRQAGRAARQHDGASALWHALQSEDRTSFVEVLARLRAELARAPETDLMLAEAQARPLSPRERVALGLAQAALWRARESTERERQELEKALQLAQSAGDRHLLGTVCGALGKYHERREPDRALAYYLDGAQALREAGAEHAQASAAVAEEYVTTLVKLAWLHSLNNDPRSRAALDQAEQLRRLRGVGDETAALLEQAWGEYWRRERDVPRALEHKHRALTLYERLGDRQQVLKTYSNLSLIYSHAQDWARASDYARRVLAEAEGSVVEPEIVCSTQLNLGTVYFWQGLYDEAIAEYEGALEKSRRAGIHLNVRWAHYNLAEAHYLRFKGGGSPEDERQGDLHAAAALAAWPASDEENIEATRQLKQQILGPSESLARDRMLPQESAVHFAEMSEVQRQREALALPLDPEIHVRAHLAIARAYLQVAAKEREAALALIDRHGLGDGFGAEFEALRQAFDRELTREQRIARAWQQATGELLSEPRRGALLARLLAGGSISKSVYAELCAVGPATASKHLGLLAERGLLVQTGRGPATRYSLPA